MKSNKLVQVISLITCFLLIVAISIRRDGKVFGHDLKPRKVEITQASKIDPKSKKADGTTVINTSELGKDIIGFAGKVPLEISIKEGKIVNIKALKNSETPDFFSQASTLLSKWNGKTPKEALAMKVDAVSGATFSSKAILGNVRAGLQYAEKNVKEPSLWEKMDMDWAKGIALLVVLMGAIIPLFTKNKTYRTIQLILNVAVLGFWTGSFISYTSIVGAVSNGINLWASIVLILMLITAFIYPLFGKKNYYCAHICPCGSLQDLAGKTNKKHKWKISPKTANYLDSFRKVLWVVLILLMLLGIWADWMDYEVFIAFILKSTSWVVIALGIIFVILAVFVPRPYCRFVCPTGTLFKFAQNTK